MQILIGGDVYPGGSIEMMAINQPEKVWGELLPLLNDADLRIVNLECSLTTCDVAMGKSGPSIKAKPETVKLLNAGSINLVTLSNNHIFDYDTLGLKDTLSICAANNIETVGADLDYKHATKTWYKEIEGIVIAVVNFSENEWSSASSARAGANPYDIIDRSKQIRIARDNSDFVIVIIHGGHECFHYPSPRMVKEYRYFAEQGASIIIGHHTHCIGGNELHKGIPIFYSLGNLIFNSTTNFAGWYQGLMLEINIDNNSGMSWKLHPFFQMRTSNKTIELIKDNNYILFLEQLSQINATINNTEMLNSKWAEFVKSRMGLYLGVVTLPSSIVRKVINKIGLTQKIASRFNLRPIHNYIRCEAHRDVIISVLNEVNND